MEARRLPEHYTVHEVAEWDGDWELFEGFPINMAPAPGGAHSLSSAALITQLSNALAANDGCRCHVVNKMEWHISNSTKWRPDIAIVCDADPPLAEQPHLTEAPALIIEILSMSTRRRDLGAKLHSYEAEGVDWYLTVDPQDCTMVVRRNGPGGYEEIAEEAIELHPGCRIPVPKPRR